MTWSSRMSPKFITKLAISQVLSHVNVNVKSAHLVASTWLLLQDLINIQGNTDIYFRGSQVFSFKFYWNTYKKIFWNINILLPTFNWYCLITSQIIIQFFCVKIPTESWHINMWQSCDFTRFTPCFLNLSIVIYLNLKRLEDSIYHTVKYIYRLGYVLSLTQNGRQPCLWVVWNWKGLKDHNHKTDHDLYFLWLNLYCSIMNGLGEEQNAKNQKATNQLLAA